MPLSGVVVLSLERYFGNMGELRAPRLYLGGGRFGGSGAEPEELRKRIGYSPSDGCNAPEVTARPVSMDLGRGSCLLWQECGEVVHYLEIRSEGCRYCRNPARTECVLHSPEDIWAI
jgi:hypothetical protein